MIFSAIKNRHNTFAPNSFLKAAWSLILLAAAFFTSTLPVSAHAIISANNSTHFIARHAFARSFSASPYYDLRPCDRLNDSLASSNDTLTNLILSQGSLSPAFSRDSLNYTASVGNAVTSVTLRPFAADSTATILVNGTGVISGQASTSLALGVGQNVITIRVTAHDAITSRVYTLTIIRLPSSNDDLSGLAISNGNLDQPFAQDSTSYTASVVINQKKHTIFGVGDSMTVRGQYQSALNTLLNSVFRFINFGVAGDTTAGMRKRFAAVTAAAPDYVIIFGGINDVRSGLTASKIENNLQAMFTAAHNTGIKVIALTITPFKGSPTWTATRQASLDSVNAWMSTAANIDYLIDTYNGFVDPSNPYQILPAYDSGDHFHPNTAGDNLIAHLIYMGAQITPNPLIDQANAANSSIAITPQAADTGATITVNGIPVPSGSASAAVPLSIGANHISTVVTAADGVTSKTYSITINGLRSNNANLANLYPNFGPGLNVNPPFFPDSTSYFASVVNATIPITVVPTTSDPGATVTVNGLHVLSGRVSQAISLALGLNTITTVVTAPDGVTTKTYTLTIKNSLSSNAAMSKLTISSGVFTPVFATGTTNYNVAIANANTSLTVTPTTGDINAKVTVNGNAVTSGTASTAIPLAVGANTITITVTAQDSVTTKTYTITATRASSLSSVATLNSISVRPTTVLTKTTGPGNVNYTASVPNSIASLTETAVAKDTTATITINGIPVVSGVASSAIPLNAGSNTITTVVTAQDGVTTQTYIITINRASSTVATLTKLTLSSGTLSPVFVKTTSGYTAAVPNTTTSLTVTPTTTDGTANVTVNGNITTSGIPSPAIPLVVGANTITVAVTAQDGVTMQTYTLTVTRAPSSVASLASISIKPLETLTKTTGPATSNYITSVPYNITSVTETAVSRDSTATITINGAAVLSGAASAGIPLIVGANTITTVITAQDGITTQNVIITVTRLAAPPASLFALTVSSGTLAPAFATTTTSYSVSEKNNVASVFITPTASDSTSTITVNGTAVASGSPSQAIPLTVGQNTIAITVTARDSSTFRTYSLTVNRAASTNAKLLSLVASGGGLTPAFNNAITSYTKTVTNATTSIIITPTVVDPTASLTLNGTTVLSGAASAAIPLVIGANTITTVVTAQDGITTQTYTITVNRPASTNAKLLTLTTSAGALTPAFNTTITSYTKALSNAITTISVTPKLIDTTARVTVNGIAVASGTASATIPLSVGANTITTVVTAQDGQTTQTYTITVNRAASTNAKLLHLVVSGGLTPAFNNTITSYTKTVSNAITGISVTPTTIDSTATITVNGTVVASGTASGNIALNVGSNVINTVVTAQDGITSITYTITITRAPSTNAKLLHLVVSGGLTPVFNNTITSYTKAVSNTITSIAITPTALDSTATIMVNGTPVASGSSSGSIALNIGSNIISTLVTAQDGATSITYTITVTRAASANAKLLSLSTSGGLSPAFNNTITSYTKAVANSVTSVIFTPTVADKTATIAINDSTAVSSGSPSPGLPLAVGDNIEKITVTAQDGITAITYTVTVTRAPGSMNAVYQPIAVEKPVTTPAFDDDIIVVHQGISPNADGINDFLMIDGILAYPENKLQIMNRNGALIFEAKGYDNSSKVFDGHSNKNGQMQLPGTYFYSLDYIARGVAKHKTGFILLKY